jgi:hypothetical protein
MTVTDELRLIAGAWPSLPTLIRAWIIGVVEGAAVAMTNNALPAHEDAQDAHGCNAEPRAPAAVPCQP